MLRPWVRLVELFLPFSNMQMLRIENYDLFRVLHYLLYDYGRRTDCHVTLSPPKAERSEAVKL